ncbi:hypothetical protein D6J78_12735 [Salmonella enterica subsp. enterica serovar Abaetetuba]|nr:hypothetical protein [Salmonella enterica]EBS0892530.1 hypothetical protein [Salmonella enterica subsp. enterica serovar Abaetetuba]ECD1968224.1 hypothetical protein [Salmonella enterica subsp. enterica serovar Abaetetuba]ECE0472915.1 hypothetical protein [Salmonella enterica subsp. enterica serovar Glostrup]ECH8208606.1 hypothetical protein [Salmonella enterica subsp. enterica]
MNMYQKSALIMGFTAAATLMNSVQAAELTMAFTTVKTADISATYAPAAASYAIVDRVKAGAVLGTVNINVPVGIRYGDIHFEDTDGTAGLVTFKNTEGDDVVRAKVSSVMGGHAISVNNQKGVVEEVSGGIAVLNVVTDKEYTHLKAGTYSDTVTISVESL